jgi:hypothetical protein
VLTLGLRTTDGLVAVRSGLAAGQRLVVRGAEALDDGALVLIEGAKPTATVAKDQPAPPAPQPAGKP